MFLAKSSCFLLEDEHENQREETKSASLNSHMTRQRGWHARFRWSLPYAVAILAV